SPKGNPSHYRSSLTRVFILIQAGDDPQRRNLKGTHPARTDQDRPTPRATARLDSRRIGADDPGLFAADAVLGHRVLDLAEKRRSRNSDRAKRVPEAGFELAIRVRGNDEEPVPRGVEERDALEYPRGKPARARPDPGLAPFQENRAC